ncbi:MAG: hypothetical protein IJ960_10160 [Oscillospiraceae bacterium]|nr:hypothetical protein [Oscillospiraceae bacterium]
MEMTILAILIVVVLVLTVILGREAGLPLLLCILGTALTGPVLLIILLIRKWKLRSRKQDDPYSFRARFEENPQRYISILLYVALLSHSFTLLLADLEFLVGLIPVLGVITVVSVTLFFLLEAVTVPPLGLLILTAVSAVLFLVMPWVVTLVLAIAVEGVALLVFGSLIAAATSLVVIVVVNGVMAGVAVLPMVTLPVAVGSIAASIAAMLGTGIATGMDAAMQQLEPSETVKFRRIVLNLLLVLLVVWPVLSWVGAYQGIFGFKPMMLERREHLNFNKRNENSLYRSFFENPEEGGFINGEQNWTFGEGFYDSYIYPGRNSFAQGKYPSASSGQNIAFCLNGMIYLHYADDNGTYRTAAYDAVPEDAMVMAGEEAFLFGDDEILLLGPDGRCKWKDTRWRTEFNKLSEAEQYSRLYDILEEQNDGVSGAVSIEDVAVVAYAQRNGLLLYYDRDTHRAYFGQEGKKGKITVLCQSATGTRTEVASFTPHCASDNLPYTMIDEATLAYIDENKIVFQGVEEDWSSVHYTNETNPFVSLHVIQKEDGTVYLAYADREDTLCMERLGDEIKRYQFDTERYEGVYSVGNNLFCVVYDRNLINRLTYIQDLREDETIMDVYTEKWSQVTYHFSDDLWDPPVPEETIPWDEQPFGVRFPFPELGTSAGQEGLYRDNVVYPDKYATYWGPAEGFVFRFPRILYDQVDYTWSEDETEVCIRLSCSNGQGSLNVTLRPNVEGMDHQTLMETLLAEAQEAMTNETTVRSGPSNEDGTASTFCLRGYAPDNDNLICTRLCRVDSRYIMEMELLVPFPVDNEDRAYKEFYIMAMEALCGFGSGDSDEMEPFWSFKKQYVD